MKKKFKLEDTEMRSFRKHICAALTAGLVLIPVEMTFATPMIMPGAVDITNANAPEDYFPEIKTVNHYDESGLPFDDDGGILGTTWYYDADKKLYCKYSNEGELITQEEYPYTDVDVEFGELDIQLSYKRSYGMKVKDNEAVLYLMTPDYFLYAIRIPCDEYEYVISIPAGEYTAYAVQSYDYDEVIIDCPNLPTGCYIPVGETGHMDLNLELTFPPSKLDYGNYKNASAAVAEARREYEMKKASIEEASMEGITIDETSGEETTRESMTFTDANGNLLTTAGSSDWITTVPAPTSAYDAPSANRTTDSLLDYVAAENEVGETNDNVTTMALFVALVIISVALALAVVILAVYIIASRKKKK